MRKTKIYLDTSVISFLYADDAPDLKAATHDFFENYVGQNVYAVHISEMVVAEIERTVDPEHRRRLRVIVEEYAIPVLATSEEAERLAQEYVESAVIPSAHREDALHVAVATVNEMDILLSWNFKHLANIKRQIGVKIVNERNGYFYPLLLTNPMEVLYEDL